MVGLRFWKKKRFVVEFEGVQRQFLSERKGEVIPWIGAEDGKSNSGKSDTRNLEAGYLQRQREYRL